MRGKTFVRMAILWVLVGPLLPLKHPRNNDALSLLALLGDVARVLAAEKDCADWEHGRIRAEGKAAAPDWARNPAQAQILATEGARAMAYKRLAECIAGVTIVGGTDVQKATTEDAIASSGVKGIIKGARVVQEEVREVAGAVMGVVTLEVPLHGDGGLGSQIPPQWRGDIQQTATPSPAGQGTPLALPSPPAAPAIDGLILDARGLPARSSLYPQVLADGGQVVYHAASVDREHWERIGRVTSTVEKAKALLQEQGVTNPIVVKAIRVEGYSNYFISVEDTKNVLSADRSTQFLRKSRVFLVLN